MQQINQTAAFTQQTKITFPAAKKAVESMNLINGFLFDSSIENEDDASFPMLMELHIFICIAMARSTMTLMRHMVKTYGSAKIYRIRRENLF